jgi:hypothetical protein
MVTVLPMVGVEVHVNGLQAMIEQFQLFECGHRRLGKLHRCSEIRSGSWDAPDYPTCPRASLQ